MGMGRATAAATATAGIIEWGVQECVWVVGAAS